MISRNTITWILIGIIIALSLYVLYWTKTEGFQCLSDPYGYTMELLEESNDAPVECMCTAFRPGKAVSVKLTKEGFSPIIPKEQTINTTSPFDNSWLDPVQG